MILRHYIAASKLLHKYCTVIVELTYKIQSLFKTRKQQQDGRKEKAAIKFYRRLRLPVITWYKHFIEAGLTNNINSE